MAKRSTKSTDKIPFLTDIKTLREHAQKSIGDGGITPSYEGNVGKAI